MNRQVAARKIQQVFRRRLIFTNNQLGYKLSKTTITAQIVSFKLPTRWRDVFDSEPKGFSEIVGYNMTVPIVRWDAVSKRWLGEEEGVTKLIARYRNVTIVFSDAGFDVLGAGNYEQALLAIVKSGWAPKMLLKAPPKYKKIDGMFNVNHNFDMEGLARELRKLPDTVRDSVKASDTTFGFGIPAVILKLKNPKFTYQFFENGTVLCSGAKDPKDADAPRQFFKRLLTPEYGIGPAFVFDYSKRAHVVKPKRVVKNATERLAERYKSAGTWDKLKPAPEGYYIRPGTDGKPRFYPWVEFVSRGNATYGAYGELHRELIPQRQMNLKGVAPKVVEAFKKWNKPIPAATAKVFANAGHPLVERNEAAKKEPAQKNRRAPSWNATKPGFYVRPGPGRQPYWFAIPTGLASGKKTVIKTYTDAGVNIPKAVREIFKIGTNVKTEGEVREHVVKMGLNGLLRINDRQAARLTTSQLLAIARNMNIARATNKMKKDALIALIQSKAGAKSPNRSFNTVINGTFYTLGNNGRVTRTTNKGVQTHRAWVTLSAEEQNKIASKVLPANARAEYNAMPKSNKFDVLRMMANANRKKVAAAAKAKANAVAKARTNAAAKAKANAEEAARNAIENARYELELEFSLRTAQNLGNLYKNKNESAFFEKYNNLPKGARGKPLKANIEKTYKAFIRNLKTQRSDMALRNAYKSSINIPNWMPANKVVEYKTVVTNLAFQKPRPKVANFKAAVKSWVNRTLPQSPARPERQVENVITGEKRVIPAHAPVKRKSSKITLPVRPGRT
jgi:hypothetical protein